MKKVSRGFKITYPENVGSGKPTLFKIFFGRKYLIWKGKSFFQSLEILSKSIDSCITKGNLDETNYMYHVVAHILKNKILMGVCRENDVYTDFDMVHKNEPKPRFSGYKMLVDEQNMIDEAIESNLCLNNNVQAYVPENTAYISNTDKEKFLRWYEKRHK